MKKILMGIGALGAITVPVAAVISCSFAKTQTIEKYVLLPKFVEENNDENINVWDDSATLNGNINKTKDDINFAINDSITAYNKAKGDIIGVLPYRTNSNGIIMSNGWGSEDIENFSKLFEMLSWYDDKDILSSVYGFKKLPHNTDMDRQNENEQQRPNTFPEKNPYTPSFLELLNIRHGLKYSKGSTFDSFFNKKVNSLNAISDEANKNQNIFGAPTISSFSKLPDDFDDSYDEGKVHQDDEWVTKWWNAFWTMNFEPTNKENFRLQNEKIIQKMYGAITIIENMIDNGVGLKFNKLNSNNNDVFKFWFYTNKDEEADKTKTPEKTGFSDVGYDVNGKWSAELDHLETGEENGAPKYHKQIAAFEEFFKNIGVNVKFIITNNVELLKKEANSNDRSFVYMPVDKWASDRKGGSLVLQSRRQTTIGESQFDTKEIKFTRPKITVNESQALHFLQDFPKTFPALDNKNWYTIETLSKVIDYFWNKKQVEFWTENLDSHNIFNERVKGNADYLQPELKERIDISGVNGNLSGNRINFINREIKNFTDSTKEIANKVAAIESIYRECLTTLQTSTYYSKMIQSDSNLLTEWTPEKRTAEDWSLNVGQDGVIEYLNPVYYTQYRTKYVTSDFTSRLDEASKIFVTKLAEKGPTLGDDFTWRMNIRDNLPLPLSFGGPSWNGETLNENILAWVNKHFML